MRRLLSLLLCTFLVSSACESDSGDKKPDGPGTSPVGPAPTLPTDVRAHKSTGASWTFLVYMHADNNLEEAGLFDLQEMASVGSANGLNIVVQVDRATGESDGPARNLGNFTSTKRVLVNAGSLTELADLGEQDMDRAETLADFVKWGVSSYPADRYAIIFWNHGAGWPGFGGDNEPHDADYLSLADITSGLDSGMKSAGLAQFDLIGFDACLMATFEIVMALRSFGEYLLSSEELEPGHGWDYASLQILKDDPSSTPVALGERIIAGFKQQAQQQGQDASITLSLVDLYQAASLFNAVSALATRLRADLAGKASTVAAQRQTTLEFGKSNDPSQSVNTIDLGHLATKLGAADGHLKAEADAVVAALSSAVLHRIHGPTTTAATGLSIYFPPAAHYTQGYDQLPDIAPWRDFLKDLFHAGQNLPAGQVPTFTNAGHVAQVAWAADGLTIAGQLATGTVQNVASAQLTYGVVDPGSGSVVVTGDSTAAVDASGLVGGTWNAAVLMMQQGAMSSYCYLSANEAEGGYVELVIPIAYAAPGWSGDQMVLLEYVLDPAGNLVQETYYLVTEGGLGELYPAAGATMKPLVLLVASDGSSEWSYVDDNAFDPFGQIDFDWESLPDGTTVYVEVDVVDFGGHSDYVYWSGPLGGGTACVPACGGAQCGSDGCGGTCGSCAAGQTCSDGQCSGGGTGDPCQDCLATTCGAETQACMANPSCVALDECLGACWDEICQATCVETYPAGYDDAAALYDCADYSCAAACGGMG